MHTSGPALKLLLHSGLGFVNVSFTCLLLSLLLISASLSISFSSPVHTSTSQFRLCL